MKILFALALCTASAYCTQQKDSLYRVHYSQDLRNLQKTLSNKAEARKDLLEYLPLPALGGERFKQ